MTALRESLNRVEDWRQAELLEEVYGWYRVVLWCWLGGTTTLQ